MGFRETRGRDDTDTMWATYNLALCLLDVGRSEEAVAELKSLLVSRYRILGPSHTDTLITAWRQALTLQIIGRPDESLAVLEDVRANLKDIEAERTWRRGGELLKLAGCYRELKRNDRAAELMAAACKMVDAVPDNQTQRHGYAAWLNDLAAALATFPDKELRDSGRAVELATKACELTEYKKIAYVKTLLVALSENGKLAEASQVCLQAAEECHEMLPKYEKLTADRSRHQDCWSFAINCEQIAQLLNEISKKKEAEGVYRDAQVIWIKLVADFNIEDDRWHLAVNHDVLGHLLRDSGRLDEAAGSYQEALGIWEKLASEADNIDRHNHLSWTRIALANLYRTQGKLADAQALVRDAEAAAIQLIHRAELAGNADQLATAYAGAIRPLMAGGRRNEAEDLCRKLLALAPGNGSADNNVAWFLATAENPAYREPALAVELAKKAVELNPQAGSWWNTLGAAHYRAGDWQPALEALGKSMELRKGGGAHDWFFLAMAHWQLGDRAEARKWYDQAVAWMDQNRPHDQQLRRFRAEAAELIVESFPATQP